MLLMALIGNKSLQPAFVTLWNRNKTTHKPRKLILGRILAEDCSKEKTGTIYLWSWNNWKSKLSVTENATKKKKTQERIWEI